MNLKKIMFKKKKKDYVEEARHRGYMLYDSIYMNIGTGKTK